MLVGQLVQGLRHAAQDPPSGSRVGHVLPEMESDAVDDNDPYLRLQLQVREEVVYRGKQFYLIVTAEDIDSPQKPEIKLENNLISIAMVMI